MKVKKLLALLLVLVCVFSLAACQKNDNLDNTKVDTEVVDGETLENTTDGNDSTSENILLTQNINRSELGLTMELSGNYSDCKVVDLDESGYKAISDKAIAGFNIVKTLNGADYILSSIAVVDSSATQSSEDRAKFPYIFAGSGYSIVATLPTCNASDSSVYEQINQLQAGIMQQLCTIFFDESALTTSNNSGSNDVVTNESEGETSTTEDSTTDSELSDESTDTNEELENSDDEGVQENS